MAASSTSHTPPEKSSASWDASRSARRVLRSCVAAAETFTGELVGVTLDLDGSREGLRRFDCLAVTRATTGSIEAMSLWAGESVGAVKEIQPASEILRELVAETESFLNSTPTHSELNQMLI